MRSDSLGLRSARGHLAMDVVGQVVEDAVQARDWAVRRGHGCVYALDRRRGRSREPFVLDPA